jgi:tyrosinase
MKLGLLTLFAVAFACKSGIPNSVRHEWRELRPEQQSNFINSLRCLKKAPSILDQKINSPSRYDDFVYIHFKSTLVKVGDPGRGHGGPWFLPWHRIYISEFETALRDECGYEGMLPYWDCNQLVMIGSVDADSNSFATTSVWKNSGFGDIGGTKGKVRSCVTSGPFMDWATTFSNATKCITRNVKYSDEQITTKGINFMIAYQDVSFLNFTRALGSAHGAVHVMLGGTMESIRMAANDPMFFLNHANVDRIWALWQDTFMMTLKAFLILNSILLVEPLGPFLMLLALLLQEVATNTRLLLRKGLNILLRKQKLLPSKKIKQMLLQILYHYKIFSVGL